MDAVVTIDFGNSYSKVSIRRSREEETNLAKDSLFDFDDGLDACVPTLAAHVPSRDRWFFGTDVLQLGSNLDDVQVYRNWKPYFFEEAPDDLDVGTIGTGYFKWLRENLIDPNLYEMGIMDPQSVPLRVTLPSLRARLKAEQRLNQVMQRSGIQMADVAPYLPEPVANSIGVFSEGRNAVWCPDGRRDLWPDYGRMFSGSRFLRAMAHRRENKFYQRMYWVLVADLGGYTLDLSMIGFDLSELDVPLGGCYKEMNRLGGNSYPIGVTDLDWRVRGVLNPEHQPTFDGLADDIDQRRLEAFHRNVYQHGRPFQMSAKAWIGKDKEWDRIRDVIEQFGEDVAEYAENFMVAHQYERIDEMILTGGGSSIGIVRDAIFNRLEEFRLRSAYVPSLADEEETLPDKYRRLPPLLARGATALGGSSIFFDYQMDKRDTVLSA